MMQQSNYIINQLNEDQKKAVTACDCNLLIIAGAGSGKTKTLTHKIAYILNQNLAKPHEILALTFTNKAANEMKERIEKLIGSSVKNMWIGTFHSIALRILRYEGITPIVYDTKDSESLIKEILKKLNIDAKKYAPKSFLNKISLAKLKLKKPEDIQETTPYDKMLKRVYKKYEEELSASNAVDFDNIIIKVIDLFQGNKELKEKYSKKFKYIFIDEYQDTNYPQYLFVKLLHNGLNKVCAVGDEDQSIYSFRGAEVENIIRFDKDYENCRVIKLQKNYRSAQEILNIANNLISKNSLRNEKHLYSDKSGGKITINGLSTDSEEADFVARKIITLRENGENLSEIAILYRTNFQSRAIEESLIRYSIPYSIIGSKRFLERKEVKDILAYLRLLANKQDNISFLRAITSHPRGVGQKLIEKIQKKAEENKISLFEASKKLIEENRITNKQKTALSDFLNIFDIIDPNYRVDYIIDKIIEISGYKNYLEDKSNSDRMANVMELKNTGPLDKLDEFLENLSLLDYSSDLEKEIEKVKLMTIHAAKGLEFNTVFVVGLEEGLFPNENLKHSEMDIEEERRLFYVAITRAKTNLFITYSQARKKGSQYSYTIPSRFLKELKTNEQKKKPKRGDRVKHSLFGEGVVLSAEEDLLLVRFKENRVRKILTKDRNLITL